MAEEGVVMGIVRGCLPGVQGTFVITLPSTW